MMDELKNILSSAGQAAVGKLRENYEWKRIFVNSGSFFSQYEQHNEEICDDLERVLSVASMEKIARSLSAESGYEFQKALKRELELVMNQYEIPHDIAEGYVTGLVSVILDQVKAEEPEKYDRIFSQEWREEQKKELQAISEKLEKVDAKLTIYRNREIDIFSADEMDLQIKRSTVNPKIGIDFFEIDDEDFKRNFEKLRQEERIYVKCRCMEEGIYCLINELWKANEQRPVFVVKSKEDWKKLQNISEQGNMYIPWFWEEEITAISGNTNIFVITEDMPVAAAQVLELKPRTLHTLETLLQRYGMDIGSADKLLCETHGLYIPMKKKIFNGLYLKVPKWLEELTERTKKTCLLLGQWTDAEGDKLLVETLSGTGYEEFMNQIEPYMKGEDPFIYSIQYGGKKIYCLASVENTWDYMSVSVEEPMWERFVQNFKEVWNEAEPFLTYTMQEQMVAHWKGERIFWSETVRKGMLRSVIMKACYDKEECQWKIDQLIDDILMGMTSEEQWKYVSSYFQELCEASPKAVLRHLWRNLDKSGFQDFFRNQSGDWILGENRYVNILFGIEQLLVQKQYAAEALRWLLCLDDLSYEYSSNNPRDILKRVFCIGRNFSAFQKIEEKVKAAETAFENDQNAWELIQESLPGRSGAVFGMSKPRYREYVADSGVSSEEMKELTDEYVKLLLKHMEFLPDRWKKLLKSSEDMTDENRKKVFEELLYETTQMKDDEIVVVKDTIRKIIYRNRVYVESSRALPEKKLVQYEELLHQIRTSEPEYEYEYLFRNNGRGILLHPIPYEEEEARKKNLEESERIIEQQLREFKAQGYRLSVLAEICGKAPDSSLGRYLAVYWDEGKFHEDVFRILLSVQKSGKMALDYYRMIMGISGVDFQKVKELAEENNEDIMPDLYEIEAWHAEELPEIAYAEEEMKKLFWKKHSIILKNNPEWVLEEAHKYGTAGKYLEVLYDISQSKKMTGEELYDYLLYVNDIPLESDPSGNEITMMQWYLTELLKPLQERFADDAEKCEHLIKLEINFYPLLEWEDMRCFQRELKRSPKLFAEMAAIIYRKDNDTMNTKERTAEENKFVHSISRLFEKVRFCPAEENHEVEEEMLRKWVEEFRVLLKENSQERLLGYLLGRLFPYAPKGSDGYVPCEAVRKVIEEYADEHMIDEYEVTVYNSRGIHSPSAGRQEKKLAEKYGKIAEELNMNYPKTAEIYQRLCHTYQAEAKRERIQAENMV